MCIPTSRYEYEKQDKALHETQMVVTFDKLYPVNWLNEKFVYYISIS